MMTMRPVERRIVTVFAATALVLGAQSCATRAPDSVRDGHGLFTHTIVLPTPVTRGDRSLEEVLNQRRSVRDFAREPLSLGEIGQLFWAAQGITSADGKRTAPSAGALYPLELYALTDDTVFHYVPRGHRADVRDARPWREEMRRAVLGQDMTATAPVVIVVAAVPARTTQKYGRLADAFVQREAGHATENLLLEATALDLAAVPVGGVDAAAVAALVALPPGEEVIYVVPVGRPLGGDG